MTPICAAALRSIDRVTFGSRDAIAQRDDREDVTFDVDLAGDVRAGKCQLAASAGDDAMDRLGTHDAHRGRCVDRADARAVVAFDCDRKISSEQIVEQLLQAHWQPPSHRGLALVSSL